MYVPNVPPEPFVYVADPKTLYCEHPVDVQFQDSHPPRHVGRFAHVPWFPVTWTHHVVRQLKLKQVDVQLDCTVYVPPVPSPALNNSHPADAHSQD